MSDVVHIISLRERRQSIEAEMDKHGITAVYWNGITEFNAIKNINLSHKEIVNFAKENNLPSILVAEDDMRFFGGPGKGFKYFLENRPKEDYDLYLSSFYSGDRLEGNRIKNVAGLTLYECMASFYDTFLSVPNDRHIDRAISTVGGKFFVSPMFCTFQQPGYSYQRKRWADDNKRIEKQPKFEG